MATQDLYKKTYEMEPEISLFNEEFDSIKEMSLSDFTKLYCQDMKHRLRPSTYYIKKQLIYQKIIPYLGSLPLYAIRTSHIRAWQNHLISAKKSDGQSFSPTYLKTINNQLNAIFNYAVKFYNLPDNPCRRTGSIGKSAAKEMQFWTREEFNTFICSVPENSLEHAAFMLLYYSGMRIGEMLALTAEDIDLENGIITISKSYQRLGGEDIISAPKTPKSNRVITIPKFLSRELAVVLNKEKSSRIFTFRREHLTSTLNNYASIGGVKRIRLHDLRHSHASLLIEMGFDPLLISDRLGHEKVATTLNIYSHLYPNKQKVVAERLDEMICKDKVVG